MSCILADIRVSTDVGDPAGTSRGHSTRSRGHRDADDSCPCRLPRWHHQGGLHGITVA